MAETTSKAPDFTFDPTLSPDENIKAFIDHLAAKNPQLAALLALHVDKMVPLPEDSQARSDARARFNAAVLSELEKGSEP